MGFNGAVGFRLRRLAACRPKSPASSTLQWGRRFSPTETEVGGAPFLVATFKLQWGRRFSPTETRSVMKRGEIYLRFNGAVGFRLRRPPGVRPGTV